MDLEFATSKAKTYFKALTGTARRKFQAKRSENNDNEPVTLKDLTRFASKYGTLCSRVLMDICFVNPRTGHTTEYFEHCVNLSSPGWFEDLCDGIRCSNILTLEGKSIRNMTMQDLMDEKFQFKVETREDRSKYVPSKRLSECFERHVRDWWKNTVIDTLYQCLVCSLTSRTQDHTLAKFLNSYTLEKVCMNCCKEILDEPQQYANLGCRDTLQVFSTLGTPLSASVICDFLCDRILYRLRHLLVAGKETLEMFISHKQHQKAKLCKSKELSSEEYKEYYEFVVSRAFCDLGGVDSGFSALLKQEPTYFYHNRHLELKKQHSLMHQHTHEYKNKIPDHHLQDTSLHRDETIDNGVAPIDVPYHVLLTSGSTLPSFKELTKSLQLCHPLTIHSVKHRPSQLRNGKRDHVSFWNNRSKYIEIPKNLLGKATMVSAFRGRKLPSEDIQTVMIHLPPSDDHDYIGICPFDNCLVGRDERRQPVIEWFDREAEST